MLERARLWLTLILSVSLLGIVALVVATPASADDLDQQVRAVARRLQCPICESVNVADSPSELAGQMRAIIRTKLEQGQSSDEIVAYFVERYGESVLVEPPRHGVGLIVWVGPLAALILGAVALTFWLRSSRRPALSPVQSDARGVAPNNWQLNLAQRELDDMSKGRSG